MSEGAYYIYALKDPRTSPAKPFYIGKGTGIRAWEHLKRVDDPRKDRRIAKIREQGHELLVVPLVDELTELQALKLEAELISAFGTEATGGILTNSVQPSGLQRSNRESLNVPVGVTRQSAIGFVHAQRRSVGTCASKSKRRHKF